MTGREAALAREALRHLGPDHRDDYDAWLGVGMALRQLGDDGLALWDAWSSPSPRYEPGACAAKWDTFLPGGVAWNGPSSAGLALRRGEGGGMARPGHSRPRRPGGRFSFNITARKISTE